jgi:hypothetical protein
MRDKHSISAVKSSGVRGISVMAVMYSLVSALPTTIATGQPRSREKPTS